MKSVLFCVNPGVDSKVMARKILCSVVLVLAVAQISPVFANDEAKKQEQTREQLRNIERQLEVQNAELEQQKKRAVLLEKQVECNWALLQSYQRCQEEFDRTAEQQVNCTSEAKSIYRQCLDKLGK